jgi:M6 family metalloprotease-like protein
MNPPHLCPGCSPAAAPWPRRRSPWAPPALLRFAALVMLLIAPAARATTLSPSHPVWRTPGVDLDALARELGRLRETSRIPLASPRARPASAAPQGKLRLGPQMLAGPAGTPSYGSRVLVIPVLFADGPADPPVAREELERRLFDRAARASYASFLADASRGAFTPAGTVVPWMRLPQTRGYYSNVRDGVAVGNAGPHQMVRDAVCGAARFVDVSSFDSDGPDGLPGSGDDDGRIDLLLVLQPDVAFEVDPSPQGNRFLSHMDRAPSAAIHGECGVGADPYVMVSAQGPLGVWVHETMHLLGLEDLYDVSVHDARTVRRGLGIWSLMADGAWGGGGERPSDLDALSRSLLGWGTEQDVSSGGAFVLPPSETEQAPWLRLCPLGPWIGESFLLEVRRPRPDRTADSALPGAGVLLYHVDDAFPLNCMSPTTCGAEPGAWVELLQADGRGDLEQRVNWGDATDPYTGAAGSDRAANDTDPSTRSHHDDAEHVPPVIAIGPADGSGAHAVTITLAPTPRLRLLRAVFPDAATGPRVWLRPGETSPWDLAFRDAGPPARVAQVRVLGADPDVQILGSDPIVLQLAGGEWRPADSLAVRTAAAAAPGTAPAVRLGLSVDGGVERVLELGVPIGFLPGLAGEAFNSWTPEALAAPATPTVFVPLAVQELPLPAVAGWQTLANGAPGYAPDADVALSSPWFAVPAMGELVFWSRMGSEGGQPGEAWDGGVVELWDPEHGWQPVVPSAGPLVRIAHRSTAATRGRIGLGAGPWPWSGVRAPLPAAPWPERVRLRFASNGAIQKQGWGLAAAGTEPSPGFATLRVTRPPGGSPTVDAEIRGDLPGIATVRLAWREPFTSACDTCWTALDPVRAYTPSSPRVSFPLVLPQEVRIATLGLFSVEAPRILLGTAGYRTPDPATLRLAAAPNPAVDVMQIEVAPQAAAQVLRIHDLRGRQVRSVVVPPYVVLAPWDGRDDRGTRVASGVYVVSLDGNASVRLAVTFLR